MTLNELISELQNFAADKLAGELPVYLEEYSGERTPRIVYDPITLNSFSVVNMRYSSYGVVKSYTSGWPAVIIKTS